MSNFLNALTQKEYNRQKQSINLIASENLPSPAVIDLLGGLSINENGESYRSLWVNKYGEGYPGKRYYAGNENTDTLELYCQKLALDVFTGNCMGKYGVNVQMNSGSMANMMVYLSVLEFGDMVMSLNVASGGHISHMHQTSNWTKFFKYTNYELRQIAEGDFEIDVDDFKSKILANKPKLVIIGCSSYPRAISNYKELIDFAHENGALVLCDVAHINGLIAAQLHASPFDCGADFISMTTHKTLRGPRAALLFAKNEFMVQINKTVFPGTSGGPHFNKIAAIARSLEEILGIEHYPDKLSFKEYSKKLIVQTKLLENTIKNAGIEIISPTQTHLMLAKLPEECDSLDIQRKLENIGIITNRNGIPNEKKPLFRPSGLRLGTAALTSRGASDEQIIETGKIIVDCILSTTYDKNVLEGRVKKIVDGLNWWY